jgi:predicted transport protein
MDLSQADLIRNYILMGLGPNEQQNIYSNYWLLMERRFSYEKQSSLMDEFFRHYLLYKSGKNSNRNKIYEEFKQYHRKYDKGTISDFCKDLLTNAIYYTNMLNADTDDKELDGIFDNIRNLQMTVALPFLLCVYSDYVSTLIDKATFCSILRICESYVFRRAICGIPTNSLDKTFMLAISRVDPADYLDSIKAFFASQDSYKIFPTDTAFVDALKVKDIYNMRVRNYILSKLENYQNKAPINIDNFTIEHIMPQNSNAEWKEALGADWEEVHKTYLHTIGNLTLTAYNSEMSDRSFEEKLNISGGFKESALRINSFVVRQNTWNKATIEARANELCALAKEIWPYPEISEDKINKFTPVPAVGAVNYTLSDFEHLHDGMLDVFNELERRILNISADVRREIKKLYIAFKADINFVDIVPQKSRLILSVNLKFSEVNDPKELCVDVTDKGKWGNGDVELYVKNVADIDDAMEIIIQGYSKQAD